MYLYGTVDEVAPFLLPMDYWYVPWQILHRCYAGSALREEKFSTTDVGNNYSMRAHEGYHFQTHTFIPHKNRTGFT